MRYVVSACVLLCSISMGVLAMAAEPVRNPFDLQITDAAQHAVHHGGPVGSAGAKVDTIHVFGGPGTLEGKFQDAGGLPDMQGWTSIDYTQQSVANWHVDTFGGDVIGGMSTGNRVWWCGEMFAEGCSLQDSVLGGYGNSYVDFLDWTGTVADNSVGTVVQIAFDLAYDTEYGYDFAYLRYREAMGMVDVEIWNGADTLLAHSAMFTLDPADYGGDDADEVLIRFVFMSDGAWSDADCMYPTAGAAQLDDIAVRFDGVLQGEVEDCQDEAALQWIPNVLPGTGDFAKAWHALDDLDPCRHNGTPVVAFIDDGLVVPGTGGYRCETWCYGPGGYVVNPEGGLAGPYEHLANAIVSPPVAWLPGGDSGAKLAFDVWRHFDPSSPGYAGFFFNWAVRSTDDPAGENNWTDWLDRGLGYYGGPDWYRMDQVITDLLLPDCRWIKIKLEVFEIGWVWGWEGTDSTPAPYYDNMVVRGWYFDGPAVAAREVDLLQDGFPTIGIVDFANLGANDIRLDMARSIAPAADQRNDPGDSVVVSIEPVRTGSTLNGMPRLYYNMKTNPVFDPYRAGGFTAQGYVTGGYVYSATGTIVPDKYAFNLPDSDFLYPGDVFHYYIRAQDNQGGDIGTTILPADTSGFAEFGPLSYHSSFTVRGLPSVREHPSLPGIHETPAVLFWNDYGNRGAEDEWNTSFRDLASIPGTHYDIYYTNAPSSGVGNGLGGRATSAQLAGYSTVLYEGGDLSVFTITNENYDLDPGDDIGVLDGWLRLGDRNLLVCGDNVIDDLVDFPQGNAFIANWMGIGFVDGDLAPLIGGQIAPIVRADPGNGVFNVSDEWFAQGGCRSPSTFDAVNPTTGLCLAYFLDTAGGEIYDYSAATLAHDATHNVNVIHLPYSFQSIWTLSKAPITSATRTVMLEEILVVFNEIWTGYPSDVPVVDRLAPELAGHPNPFNPKTTIAWRMPAAGSLTLKVYDVRGALVKTLLDDERVDAAGETVWAGDNDRGERVASGVYVVRGTGTDYEMTRKLAVVK